jgi:hypothetical protein
MGLDLEVGNCVNETSWFKFQEIPSKCFFSSKMQLLKNKSNFWAGANLIKLFTAIIYKFS